MGNTRLTIFAVAYRIVSGVIAAALIAAVLHVSFGVGTNSGGTVLAAATLIGSFVGLLTTMRRKHERDPRYVRD